MTPGELAVSMLTGGVGGGAIVGLVGHLKGIYTTKVRHTEIVAKLEDRSVQREQERTDKFAIEAIQDRRRMEDEVQRLRERVTALAVEKEREVALREAAELGREAAEAMCRELSSTLSFTKQLADRQRAQIESQQTELARQQSEIDALNEQLDGLRKQFDRFVAHQMGVARDSEVPQ